MKYLLNNPYRVIEKQLGYSFRHKDILATALMHRSFRFESQGVEGDNQRLEFLGDAVLGLVSTEYLFNRFPNLEEGPLTSLRSRLASGKALAQVARAIGLGAHIKLGKGERQTGGHERASNVADAMEAILGAAYIDGGLKAVGKIFKKLFLPMIDISPDDSWLDNSKGELQQITQTKWKTNPIYRLTAQDGPAHSKMFTIKVLINGRTVGMAQGSSKREAEQQAARNTLELLRQRGEIE